MLADVLTMRDHFSRPFEDVVFCYLGDARNNVANSLLVTGALLGADVRLAAPEALLPSPQVREVAERLAATSGARLMLASDAHKAVAEADFLYTDVWLSMGEPEQEWGERIKQLLPYQVNSGLLKATGNPAVKVLHCLPALHNRDTKIGEAIFQKWGLEALEVTEEVFESDASIVFDQAENRLHTVKAVMIATLAS
jgi:ornithine carbamoyltransferase